MQNLYKNKRKQLIITFNVLSKQHVKSLKLVIGTKQDCYTIARSHSGSHIKVTCLSTGWKQDA